MSQSKPANARAARFRARRRARGLRAVTIWMPDIRDPAYRRRIASACEELVALPPPEAEADAASGLADAFHHMPGWQ